MLYRPSATFQPSINPNPYFPNTELNPYTKPSSKPKLNLYPYSIPNRSKQLLIDRWSFYQQTICRASTDGRSKQSVTQFKYEIDKFVVVS